MNFSKVIVLAAAAAVLSCGALAEAQKAPAAKLVNHYAFKDAGNLMKATVGADAVAYKVEGASKASPQKGNGGIVPCEDAALLAKLGEGAKAVAVPKGDFIAIPHGIAKTGNAPWCMVIQCCVPRTSEQYATFYTLVQDNSSDAALFCQAAKGYSVGSTKWGGYHGEFAPDMWHTLIVSHDSELTQVYIDDPDYPIVSRGGGADSLEGKDRIFISGDDNGEDALMYIADIKVYDAARPDVVFPKTMADPSHAITTMPWQQNVYSNRFAIMCETKCAVDGLELQYGRDYSSSVPMTFVRGDGPHCIYKGRVAIEGMAGKAIPYRLAVNGEEIIPDGGESTRGEVRLWPVDSNGSFKCAIWGDNQQGAKGGDWDADPYQYINRMFTTMDEHDVDFGITTGDMASSGSYRTQILPGILKATAGILCRRRPCYVAWGNHDLWHGVNKRYFETGSLDELPFTNSNSGAYCMYRDNVLLIFIHWGPNGHVRQWLADLLETPRAKNAKFRVLFQHAPMYLEVWGNNIDRALLETASQGGVDMVVSGHMHGYERIHTDKGFIQVTNGGAGYLDHNEHPVRNFGAMTKVGGHMDAPYLWARQSERGVLGRMRPARMGCITSYCEMSVEDNVLNMRAFGFNADGSYIGVFDDFSITSKTVAASAPAKASSKARCANPSSFDQFTEKPVTNAKWKEYKDAVGEKFVFAEGSGDAPVVNVSKVEIRKFLRWLNGGEEGRYRLPTEEELRAKRTTLEGVVTEWTDTVDPETGWCRILGGNALAAEGVWTKPEDKPAIATEGCHANYLGFRIVK